MKYGFVNLEYENGEIIPSIVMGNGTVKVTSLLLNEDGLVGVAFTPAPHNKTVGNYDNVGYGETMLGTGVLHQMLFDNPDSIDVVIDRLIDTKNALLKGITK